MYFWWKRFYVDWQKSFNEIKRHNKFEFELVFLVMDPGYNETNRQMIIDIQKKLNIPVQIFDSQNFLIQFFILKNHLVIYVLV